MPCQTSVELNVKCAMIASSHRSAGSSNLQVCIFFRNPEKLSSHLSSSFFSCSSFFSHILLEPKERPLLFVSPVFPGSEEEETPILQAIRVHLKEGVFYFNRVRTELSEMNNSVTKRDYLLSEKARFDQTLNATIEAENLVHVFARDFFGTHTPYLQECLAQLDIMKEWAGSSEIFLLRSGRATLLRTIGRILSKTPNPISKTIKCLNNRTVTRGGSGLC